VTSSCVVTINQELSLGGAGRQELYLGGPAKRVNM